MEVDSADAAGDNHLKDILSDEELSNLPQPIVNKINIYIDKKFEEYLASKALLDSSKAEIDDKIATLETSIREITGKYEEASKQLLASNETVGELEKQIITLNAELEKANTKISSLENEAVSLKNARNSAVDERNDLTRILQRRDTEIERLHANEISLSQQLKAAIDAKCEALALNDEVQSNKLSLQYREKRIEQERVLLNSQIAGLYDEVNRLNSELQTSKLNNTSKLLSLETQISEKNEELKAANDTIEQLNEVKNNLTARVDNLTQRLVEQREVEQKMTENYIKELEAKSKLADIFKTMHDDTEAKTVELTNAIAELQKLLNEATEKYGELETKYKQAEVDHEEFVDKNNEIIASLKNELENANDLLKAANEQNLNMVLSELAPSAAVASKLFKSGMSLTQIYTELVKVTEELTQKKNENRELQITVNTIVQELEEKAPFIQKQKVEFEEALESNAALTQQVETLVIECNRLRDDYTDAVKMSNHYNKENLKLKGELGDLGRQVCFLLKEIEHSRGNLIPNGDHDSSQLASNATNSSGAGSSGRLNKALVTFSDIQELQANNQKLLGLVRELSEKKDELEKVKAQFESSDQGNKLKELQSRLDEFKEAQLSQTKMLNGLLRQRDMFKKLYHDLMNGKSNDISGIESADLEKSNSSQSMDTSNKSVLNATELSTIEIKLKETEKQLELIKTEYKGYREEKVTNERLLFEQIDRMRQEITKLTAANSKCASTSEYNNERIKTLQLNIATYKKQIAALEDKNKAYNITIAKQEDSLQRLRDEVLNAQNNIANAEIKIQNLTMTNKLMKETENRLQSENEVLNRERQGQAQLLKNLELIKVSLERVEVENRTRLESNLDEATRECSALRRRLQEEQDRFRELADHLQRQTTTANSRMQEEKDAADQLRKEIAQLRLDLIEKNKSHEDLTKKIKIALSPNADNSFDSMKQIKELENSLINKEGQVKSLEEQLAIAKEHITQYCSISEEAEKEIKTLNSGYEAYKAETEAKLSEYIQKIEQLENKCSELEAELSLQRDGEYNDSNIALKEALNKVKEELEVALTNNKTYETELQATREELSKLSESLQKAEEKYTHEMLLHSTDVQTLSQVKAELSKAQNEINELVSLRNNAVNELEIEKAAWIERQEILTKEHEQLSQRFADVCSQNSLLHDQIQALGTQLSIAHTCRLSDSVNESGEDSTINVSLNEDERKSSEQLLQIVKFLRQEKDIVLAKFDILQAETMRLRSQLEIAEKQLDETKLALAAERDKSDVSVMTINKQSDILRKVETLNALTDSNRILRNERDNLAARLEEMTASTKGLEEQMTPLREKISDLTSKCDTLKSENADLKAESARWRTRVNALVERANKTSPEDWKRLQSEREALAKMLTTEKENVKKLNEELEAIKMEKGKLEEQYTSLSRQQAVVMEENKKLNEELRSLKNDFERLTESSTKSKTELSEASANNTKLMKDLSSTEAALAEMRNKEAQIRKIAKKYKCLYEDLVKTVEEDKKKKEEESAASSASSAESNKRNEEKISELQSLLEEERNSLEKLKQEMETLRTTNQDNEEKAKHVLKQAKTKIVQLTELRNTLTKDLDESRNKIDTIEKSTRDEHDVRLALIKSQYEGRIARLEKERGEALAERTREMEALQQKVNMLQRQLATQASAAKQQASTEKTVTEPPTANIKPMAGVAQQSVSGSRRGGEPPLASIRPMAQVGPTGPTVAPPHDAHTTEYMPASSSRPIPRAALAASTAPPESTQDMETSEAGMGSSGSSDGTVQPSTHSQTPQQAVALVMPRIEQPSGASTVSAAAASALPAPAQPAQPLPGPASGGPGAGVSTSHHAPPDVRPVKRRLQPRPLATAKRTRVQGFERSVEVEYQVPTSSRCDQDDEGVIVVDSEEDDERCSGTMYREGEEDDEEMEEEQEEAEEEEEDEGGDDDNAARQDSPAQSPEAGGEGVEEGDGGEEGVEGDGEAETGGQEPDSEPPPVQQIEAISSGTEPSGTLSLGGNGGDDDSIVPSTPTLYVPRRNDGFGEAVVSPVGGSGEGAAAGSGARFTFAEAAASHQDTHADLAAALPPHASDTRAEGEQRDWEESRAEDEAAAVSSQGSEPSSPHQVAEEGREAEASAPPAAPPPRRDLRAHPTPSNNRWMRAADSGRGMRARGRGARRSHLARF